MDIDLNVSLIQADIAWSDKDTNLGRFAALMDGIDQPTDLILLPEMFATGFSMCPEEHAEKMDGLCMDWMASQAEKKAAVVCGSLIIEHEDRYYNRLVWMRPDASYEYYDKRHLFRMSGEDENYTAGQSRLVVDLNGWRVMPMVCYDLRFPVWSRNVKNDYDVALYLANWPSSRSFVWNHLLVARALENQAYVVGVNRIGEDRFGTSFRGDSAVVGPKGNLLSTIQPNMEMLETVCLSAEELLHFRASFQVWKDADEFEILHRDER